MKVNVVTVNQFSKLPKEMGKNHISTELMNRQCSRLPVRTRCLLT